MIYMMDLNIKNVYKGDMSPHGVQVFSSSRERYGLFGLTNLRHMNASYPFY